MAFIGGLVGWAYIYLVGMLIVSVPFLIYAFCYALLGLPIMVRGYFERRRGVRCDS